MWRHGTSSRLSRKALINAAIIPTVLEIFKSLSAFADCELEASKIAGTYSLNQKQFLFEIILVFEYAIRLFGCEPKNLLFRLCRIACLDNRHQNFYRVLYHLLSLGINSTSKIFLWDFCVSFITQDKFDIKTFETKFCVSFILYLYCTWKILRNCLQV